MARVQFYERKLIDRATASGIEWLNRVLVAMEKDIKLSMPGTGILRSDIASTARRATRDSLGIPQKGGIPKIEVNAVDRHQMAFHLAQSKVADRDDSGASSIHKDAYNKMKRDLAQNRRLSRQLRDTYRGVLAENIRRLKKFERIARHSRPGNPPHRQTGTLVRSITVDSVFDVHGPKIVGRVGTNLPYGKYLELGTSRMRPRPYLRPALRRMHARVRAGDFPFNQRMMAAP